MAREAQTAPDEDLRIRGRRAYLTGKNVNYGFDDGVLVEGPLSGARTLADGCWIIPGLVDAP